MFERLKNSPITLCIAVLSIGVSVLLSLRIIDPEQLYFNKNYIFDDKEYWRFFTSIFCFGALNLKTCFNLHLLISDSLAIENSFFNGKPVDFLLFALMGWTFMWIYASRSSVLFLGKSFSAYVFYYWIKHNPDIRLMLFPIPIGIPATWYLLLMILINSRGFTANLVGFAAAHIYFFIKDVIGLRYNINIFSFPSYVNNAIASLFKHLLF